MPKLIAGLLLSNLTVLWFICWPFDERVTRDSKWAFPLVKAVFFVAMVLIDSGAAYFFGMAHGTAD